MRKTSIRLHAVFVFLLFHCLVFIPRFAFCLTLNFYKHVIPDTSRHSKNMLEDSSRSRVKDRDNRDVNADLPGQGFAAATDTVRASSDVPEVPVPDGISREDVMMMIVQYLQTPYKYGGVTARGMDCSAFTGLIYESAVDISLPRTTRDQFRVGRKVDKKHLKFGDLVFFKTRRRRSPSHVGIYIGENFFAHVSRYEGVTITSLQSPYYRKRYVGARRVVEETEEGAEADAVGK